jgi:hypothetical protein
VVKSERSYFFLTQTVLKLSKRFKYSDIFYLFFTLSQSKNKSLTIIPGLTVTTDKELALAVNHLLIYGQSFFIYLIIFI